MVDFVFHIGLHKTATTFTQKYFFEGVENYVGKYTECPVSNPQRCMSRELVELLRRSQFEEPRALIGSLNDWLAECEKVVRRKASHANPIIVSDEGLAFWNTTKAFTSRLPLGASNGLRDRKKRTRPAPIVNFLNNYLLPQLGKGNIRVVLGLRNQPDWLASLYAQTANEKFRPSQSAFERGVLALLKSGDEYIDWLGWVQDLRNAVGEDCLLVRFVEDIDNPIYWKEMSEFCLLGESYGERVSRLLCVRENSRRQGIQGGWRVRDLVLHKAVGSRMFRNTSWSKSPIGRLIKGMEKKGGGSIHSLIRQKNCTSLEMTGGLREHILYSVANNNRLLQEITRTDLSSWGYY